MTSGRQQFCDFHHSHEVATVGSARCRGAPVDFEGSFFVEDYIVDDFGVEDLGEVGFYEGNRLLGTQ